jgi:hypothetical protein
MACVAVSLLLLSAVCGRLLDMGDPRAQGHDHAPLKVDRYVSNVSLWQVTLQACEARFDAFKHSQSTNGGVVRLDHAVVLPWAVVLHSELG